MLGWGDTLLKTGKIAALTELMITRVSAGGI